MMRSLLIFVIKFTVGLCVSNLWLEHFTLHEISRRPMHKIKKEYNKLCKESEISARDKQKSPRIKLSEQECHVLKELVTLKFDQIRNRMGHEFVSYWNGEVSVLLSKIFGRTFPQLKENYKYEELLYLFDPIDKNSISDYKYHFSRVNLIHNFLDKEARTSGNPKLAELKHTVQEMVEAIEQAAPDVHSSESWNLSIFKGEALGVWLEQATNLLKFCLHYQEYLMGLYTDVVHQVSKFHVIAIEVGCDSKGNVNKEQLLKAFASYQLVVRMFINLVMKEELKKNNNQFQSKNKVFDICGDIDAGRCVANGKWISSTVSSRHSTASSTPTSFRGSISTSTSAIRNEEKQKKKELNNPQSSKSSSKTNNSHCLKEVSTKEHKKAEKLHQASQKIKSGGSQFSTGNMEKNILRNASRNSDGNPSEGKNVKGKNHKHSPNPSE